MKFTTMEKLQLETSRICDAVVRYGDKVLVADLTCRGYTAKIYEFVELPEDTGLGDIECRLIPWAEAEEKFTDGGHALEWCFKQLTAED